MHKISTTQHVERRVLADHGLLSIGWSHNLMVNWLPVTCWAKTSAASSSSWWLQHNSYFELTSLRNGNNKNFIQLHTHHYEVGNRLQAQWRDIERVTSSAKAATKLQRNQAYFVANCRNKPPTKLQKKCTKMVGWWTNLHAFLLKVGIS